MYTDPICVRQVICYISTNFIPLPLSESSTLEGTRLFQMIKYQALSLSFSLCCSIYQKIERVLQKQGWTYGSGVNSEPMVYIVYDWHGTEC